MYKRQPKRSACARSGCSTLLLTFSITSMRSSPRNMEMMAGGASSPPRRLSFDDEAQDSRSSAACLSTARMTADRKMRNWALS